MYSIVSKELFGKVDISNEDVSRRLNEFKQLSHADDQNMSLDDLSAREASLFKVCKEFCLLISQYIARNDLDAISEHINDFQHFYDDIPMSSCASHIKFILDRMRGYIAYIKQDYKAAKRILCPMISSCPRVNGHYLPGFADVLIMISECYAVTGKTKDALHSARLATLLAHRQVEYYTKDHSKRSLPWISHRVYPSLPYTITASVAHYNLAQRLVGSGLSHLSGEWYQRAYTLALQEGLPTHILQQMSIHIKTIIDPIIYVHRDDMTYKDHIEEQVLEEEYIQV